MLYYESKVKEHKLTPLKAQTTPKKPAVARTSFLRWIRFFIQLLTNIAVAIITNIFTPGVGLVLDFVLSTATDLIFDLIFDGKIDWKKFAVSTAFNAIPFVSKGFRLITKTRAKNGIYSLAANANTSIKAELKTGAAKLSKFGTSVDDAVNPNFRVFEEANEGLLENMKKLDSFKLTKDMSETIYEKTNKTFVRFKKIFHHFRVGAQFLASPRYAGKKVIEFILKKPYAYINKTWNKWITKKVGKVVKKAKEAFRNTAKHIPINSSWLDSLTILKNYNPWDIKIVNAIVYFKPHETNNKEPVFLYHKRIDNVLKLLTSDSPGRYYLNNFAWGWKIGRILRQKSAFIAMSKIPLYGSLIGTINYGMSTIRTIQKSLSDFYKNGWSNNWWNEFKQGIKEYSLKGLKPKYISPLVQTTRSLITGDSGFVIRKGLRIGNRYLFNRKIKEVLNSKKYSERRARIK